MRSQTGIVLIETVVIGFAIAVLVIPLLVTVAALAQARSVVDVAAADAATWVARHGDLPQQVDPDVHVRAEVASGIVTVIASVDVPVLSVASAGPSITVSAEARATVSPYRSRPDG